MLNPDTSYHNNLVASIRKLAGEKFYCFMEIVSLESGAILYGPETRIRHVYFPTTAVVALISTMEDGATNEIATVGNEGMIGVPLFMGSDIMSSQALVRCSGYALRLKSELLLAEFKRSPATQLLLLRYTQSLFSQISHNAACNRHHSVHQQVCRWLLSIFDRQSSRELKITHESIAAILGVRRESITKEVGELQNSGIIDTGRGHITVVDRSKLEAHACECYHGIKREFARLLTVVPPIAAQPQVSTGRNMSGMGTPGSAYRPLAASV
jgi:CRP-like cAMP-binding protein